MAFPLLLPLLFSIGSTVANTIGTNQRDNATADALAAERRRQNALDDEAFALNNTARDRYNDPTGDTAKASDNLSSLFQNVLDAQPTEPIAALPQTDSNVIASRETAAADKTAAEGKAGAERLANVRGFGDYLGSTQRLQGRDAATLGMIGGFKRGSNGVLPLELDAAAQKGRNWLFLGNALNALGGFAGPGGPITNGSLAKLFLPDAESSTK